MDEGTPNPPPAVREDLPRPVREIENIWIPMPDGARLAARLWLPDDAQEHPVPAILEYLPYRKRDFMRLRDEPMHRYFAGHGYASIRVDVRGSGDSDGLLDDEYSEAEHADAEAVIRWLAAQPWCSGKVGMTGISWGGFNALQVAARQPPALAAIITLCAADDRYADDAHYMGGCLLNENQIWGSVLTLYNGLPPDPAVVGERWRAMWHERLEAGPLFPARWLGHQRRDDFWRHGSVCEDYGQIRCPVYAIGGWADGYSNAVPRLLAGLKVPAKGLIGPWAHVFPHDAVPGPSIGYLQEALRWWDHWLKDRDTGLMAEPRYRVWMQDSVRPEPYYEHRAGRWVAEDGWPSPRIAERVLHLNAAGLAPEAGGETELSFRSPQVTGLTSGDWCAMGDEGGLPVDQRPDDGRSLVFDGAPLDAPLEILGAPELRLVFSVDWPCAFVAVRLCDVLPDGTSARITYGLLNLCHPDGPAAPRALEPGRRYEAVVRLNDIAHSVPAGNRLRVAVSTSYWPIAWPSPEPVTLTVHTGATTLTLPERPPRAEDDRLRSFAPPERAAGAERTRLRRGTLRRRVERDLTTGETIYTVFDDGGEFDGASLVRIEDIDLELGYAMHRRFAIEERDPLSAKADISQHALLRRGDWQVELRLQTSLSATREAFRVTGRIAATEGIAEVYAREWDEEIPRDHV